MGEIFAKGVSVDFNDLSEDAQARIYREHEDIFIDDASKSKHYSIRMMVADSRKASTELLNEMIRRELKSDTILYPTVIITHIMKNKNFIMDEKTNELFSDIMKNFK